MKTKTKYLTKKRRAIIFKRKAIALLSAIAISSSIIGYASQIEAYEMPKDESIKHIIKNDIKVIDIKSGVIREVSAYNVGVEAQTDSSPCYGPIAGLNLCELVEKGEKICAANFVPLRSKIYIDKIGECLVLDRMNSRFENRVDIAMRQNEIDRALRFGVQNLLTIAKN